MNLIEKVIVGAVFVFTVGLLGGLYNKYILVPQERIENLENVNIKILRNLENNITSNVVDRQELNISKIELGYHTTKSELEDELEDELKDIENEEDINPHIGKHSITF